MDDAALKPQAEQSQPAAVPPRPKEPDWDDYWAHRVAEKAKTRVLSYFALATILLTIVGMKGLDEVRKAVEERFLNEVAKKEKEASAKVEKMLADFEKHIEGNRQDVAKRKEEFMRIAVISPEFRASSPSAASSILIDLTANIGAIGNQKDTNSTVGFAVAYALQAEVFRLKAQKVSLSPSSIYFYARKFDEFPGSEADHGTSIVGGLEAVRRVGAYLDKDWPFMARAPINNSKPRFKIGGYKSIGTDTSSLIRALQEGKVPVVGILAPAEFDSPQPDGRIVIAREKLGANELLHSVAVVGYDQTRAEFKIANMWGTEWGAGGLFFMRDSDLKKILQSAHVLEGVAALP